MQDRDETQAPPRKTIAIAGASGFVGRHLVAHLAPQAQVIALSRRLPEEKDRVEGVIYRTCDLFSILDAEEGLEGADVAVYLVHSMLPSARLTQAHFEEMDLLLADNFARAARHAGVERIVYLSGLVPRQPPLSPHLRSRLEVENVFAAWGLDLVALRAGLVIGPNGSSFAILEKLCRRMPVMLCPKWTRVRTHPIALRDIVDTLARAALSDEDIGGRWDVGGADILTYGEMLSRTAAALGRRLTMLPVPNIPPSISAQWVAMISGRPKALIRPLVDSLHSEMTAHDSRLMDRLGVKPMGFDEAVQIAINPSQPPKLWRSQGIVKAVSDVRSIQRLPLPPGRNAIWVTREYMRWLSSRGGPLLNITVEDGRICRFHARGFKEPLLELTWAPRRSNRERALLYITGGMLARTERANRGRLEFRVVPGGMSVLAAIHDFQPALPWYLYNLTQAQVHLYVMNAFDKYLRGYEGGGTGRHQALTPPKPGGALRLIAPP